MSYKTRRRAIKESRRSSSRNNATVRSATSVWRSEASSLASRTSTRRRYQTFLPKPDRRARSALEHLLFFGDHVTERGTLVNRRDVRRELRPALRIDGAAREEE